MIPYREETQRVLNRLEHIIKGMEYFGSNPQKPLDTCMKELKESRLFIGIIGMRYGSVVETENIKEVKSYTQLEYEEAIKNGIPTLIYIMNEDHPIPPRFVETGSHAENLRKFKEDLKKRHTVSLFTTPQDLGMKLSNDLPNVLSELDQIHVEKRVLTESDKMEVALMLKQFWRRPAKYNGYECILNLKIVTEPEGLLYSLASALDFTVGDSVVATVAVVDEQEEQIFHSTLSLYAQEAEADWLDSANVGDIVRAKVRFSFAGVPAIKEHDAGKLLETSNYRALRLIEGIES